MQEPAPAKACKHLLSALRYLPCAATHHLRSLDTVQMKSQCWSHLPCELLKAKVKEEACACSCQMKCHNACAKAGAAGGSTIAATSSALLALDQAWEEYLNKIRVDNNMALR